MPIKALAQAGCAKHRHTPRRQAPTVDRPPSGLLIEVRDNQQIPRLEPLRITQRAGQARYESGHQTRGAGDPDDRDPDRPRQPQVRPRESHRPMHPCRPPAVGATPPGQAAEPSLGLEHQRRQALELKPAQLIQPISQRTLRHLHTCFQAAGALANTSRLQGHGRAGDARIHACPLRTRCGCRRQWTSAQMTFSHWCRLPLPGAKSQGRLKDKPALQARHAGLQPPVHPSRLGIRWGA